MGTLDKNIKKLARDMRKAHGDLTEVYFIGARKYQSILHFSDGTYFPTKPVTDRDFNILRYAFQNYSYIPPEDQVDPLSLLTFGSSDTGAQCFEIFLSKLSFKMTNVENITSGNKLTKNGEILEYRNPPKTQISMKDKKGKYFPDDYDDKVDSTSKPQKGDTMSFWSRLFGHKPPADRILCFVCGRAIRNATERVDFLCAACGSRAVGHDSCLGVTGTARVQFGTAATVRCPNCGRQA